MSHKIHFLDTARPAAGDLAPVLDLEDAGSLNPQQLAEWTRTWLDTVEQSVGVKPMIYTSPSFWSSKMDDTLGIAASHPLWVAHWGVDSPSTPGAWQSWAGWQHTSKGAVAGIEGNVDQDWIQNPASLAIS